LGADAIDLTVERNVLTVHAERVRPDDDELEMLIGERPSGTFSRQLILADSIVDLDDEWAATPLGRVLTDVLATPSKSVPADGASRPTLAPLTTRVAP